MTVFPIATDSIWRSFEPLVLRRQTDGLLSPNESEEAEMAQVSRMVPDISPDDLEFQKAVLVAEGFTIEVRDQGNGTFTLLGTMDAGPAAAKTGKDSDNVEELVANGGDAATLTQAQATAKAALPGFPHNGCAANLSALLRQSGIPVPMTVGAGALADVLKVRGWLRVDVGSQVPGDVGVTFDNTDPPGADHIYLVVRPINNDEMVIADNQKTIPHNRCASGRLASGEDHGTTATEYFLRAPT